MKILKKAVNLGLAVGIVWGVYVLSLGLVAANWHEGLEIVQLSSTLYWGYGPTLGGALLGGLWGFVDGFVFGFFVGLLYKLFNKCCKVFSTCSKCGHEKCQCK